tara:strand:+ start:41 stop:406 length:366 start_codon:yes stop_codon:yes gene_type:complete
MEVEAVVVMVALKVAMLHQVVVVLIVVLELSLVAVEINKLELSPPFQDLCRHKEMTVEILMMSQVMVAAAVAAQEALVATLIIHQILLVLVEWAYKFHQHSVIHNLLQLVLPHCHIKEVVV